MMAVLGGFMLPHPPLIIPEIGRGQEREIKNTIEAYHKAAKEIAELQPDTIVVISPHTDIYADYFHVSPGNTASGDFRKFGARQVSVNAKYDTEFVRNLCRLAELLDFPLGVLGEKSEKLDHATMIPLYFVNQYITGYRLVRMGFAGLSPTENYQAGQMLQQTAAGLLRNVVVIGSGDLSHCLKKEGPYGYQKEGPLYDERIMDVMGRGAFGELFEFSEHFCDKAGECGQRSFLVMAGALDGMELKKEKLSYEGPFGVGYGICTYHVTGEDESRRLLQWYEREKTKEAILKKRCEDAYTRLARMALEHYVETGDILCEPQGLPDEMMRERAGVFVSIHKHGKLRGCIGTITPVCKNIAKEIIQNAVSAGNKDPRFQRVKKEELGMLEYSVDVLQKPEPVDSLSELDVKEYGVIVSKGRQRGLLLPDLKGVDTAEEQVAIAKQKAGISGDDSVELERFRVVRHGDKT